MFRSVICFLAILFLQACQKTDDAFFISTPEHFPEIIHPKDNAPTVAKIALGKKLFFDNRLSLDSTLSCASCHLPEHAFSDTLAVSLGVGKAKGKRNTPSLLNVGYETLFNKDGGVTKLGIFSLLPIEDHSEMGIPIGKLVERLQSDSALQMEAQNAYERDLDPYVITRALASFVRTLISGESRYDDYLNGKLSLSDNEERGRKIFFSEKAKCANCHAGILFTNQNFENNGTKNIYEDQGRKLITALESDRGRFKVPSLRNVAITGPYMHDGSFTSLTEVIEHYNSGGSKHKNQNKSVQPLNLSGSEKMDLIAFLKSLTDKKYSKN